MATPEDLAFAGLAEQAGADTAWRGLLARAHRAEPFKDRAPRPAAPMRSGSSSPSARSRRPSAPIGPCRGREGASPGSPHRRQGQRRRRGRGHHPRHGAHGGAAIGDSHIVKRLRRGGPVIFGKTNLPELALWPSPSPQAWGPTRNPWDLAAAGRLERRLGGRGRRRHGAGRARERRRRLDPDPGRLLRPLRAQAAARPRLDDARRRALVRPLRVRLSLALGPGLGPFPRRRPRPRGGRRTYRAAEPRTSFTEAARTAPGSSGSPSRPSRSSRPRSRWR